MTAIRAQIYPTSCGSRRRRLVPRSPSIWEKTIERIIGFFGILVFFLSIAVLYLQLLEVDTHVFLPWILLAVVVFLWLSQACVVIFCCLAGKSIPHAFFVFISLVSSNCSAVLLICFALVEHPLALVMAMLTLISIFESVAVFIIDKRRNSSYTTSSTERRIVHTI